MNIIIYVLIFCDGVLLGGVLTMIGFLLLEKFGGRL
jgi:hypothetical protein